MKFAVQTIGVADMLDISPRIRSAVAASGVKQGVAHVFVQGATAALFEPGAGRDLKDALKRIAPMDAHYHHNEKWDDGHGFGNPRVALMKPSLSVPIDGGQLQLGTGQQVILLDFDNSSPMRLIHVQVTVSA